MAHKTQKMEEEAPQSNTRLFVGLGILFLLLAIGLIIYYLSRNDEESDKDKNKDSNGSGKTDNVPKDSEQTAAVNPCGVASVAWIGSDRGSVDGPFTRSPGSKAALVNGDYSLFFQADGNLVLRDAASKAVWSSKSSGFTDTPTLIMDACGNLSVTSASRSVAVATTVNGGECPSSWNCPARLELSPEGTLKIIDSKGQQLWSKP